MRMGVSTLHASNIKGFAFKFARARPVWMGPCSNPFLFSLDLNPPTGITDVHKSEYGSSNRRHVPCVLWLSVTRMRARALRSTDSNEASLDIQDDWEFLVKSRQQSEKRQHECGLF